jgi:hypothetical protein
MKSFSGIRSRRRPNQGGSKSDRPLQGNPHPHDKLHPRMYASEFVGTALLVFVGLSIVIALWARSAPLAALPISVEVRRMLNGFFVRERRRRDCVLSHWKNEWRTYQSGDDVCFLARRQDSPGPVFRTGIDRQYMGRVMDILAWSRPRRRTCCHRSALWLA